MRDDRQRVQDILDAIDAIERYPLSAYEDLLNDELRRVWILYHLQARDVDSFVSRGPGRRAARRPAG
jgi:hypothetical protein